MVWVSIAVHCRSISEIINNCRHLSCRDWGPSGCQIVSPREKKQFKNLFEFIARANKSYDIRQYLLGIYIMLHLEERSRLKSGFKFFCVRNNCLEESIGDRRAPRGARIRHRGYLVGWFWYFGGGGLSNILLYYKTDCSFSRWLVWQDWTPIRLYTL